jgi:signal transduction histidine kinase
MSIATNRLQPGTARTHPLVSFPMDGAGAKTRELRALIRINHSIACSVDRDALLPRIAEEAKNILAVDGVMLRLVEGDKLVRAAYAGHRELSGLSPEIAWGKSLSGLVVRENRVLAIRNILHDNTLVEEHRLRLLNMGYRSVLGVPLRTDSQAIGAILCLSQSERGFRPDEIEIITALADQAAIAVQNCALLEAAKAKSEELSRTNTELEQATRTKAKFMAAVSHELRTPLQVIIGYADLLKDGILGQKRDEQCRVANTILHHAATLDRLIRDVLTLTKTVANDVALEVSTASVAEIMGHVQSFAEQMNRGGSLDLSWRIEEGLPPITTDVTKLEEILQNLIGNAYKFTREGRIEIRARKLSERNCFEFAVSDTGIGVEEEDREKIFDEFYQAKTPQQKNQGGVGLGLSIVKNYLSLMRGDIMVDSRPGEGTTFTFTLPYSIP